MYNKNKVGHAPVVEGCTSKEAIAEAFKNSFKRNSEPNNKNKVEELNNKFSTKYKEFSENHAGNCNCHGYAISLNTIVDAVCSLKGGKCANEDGFNAEHFQNAPLPILKHITLLFNRMLKHSFVPRQFKLGFMIPIIKDTQGNHGDTSNYRGITISPILSKIFEHSLKFTFSEHLRTSCHQFGFKKSHSTIQALHCFRTTVDYFINNGSRVYCSFLDASKAFDRLVHSGLFLKLMEKGVPKIFLDVIIFWHDGLFCRVRWDGHFSDWFEITAGVRQGGVLSPSFYSLYVDDLIEVLKVNGIGCHIQGIFVAALFYADDMAVLSPSIKGLQKMLGICSKYCADWDILLNAKKTKNLCFGKGEIPSYNIKLNGDEIQWEHRWKYLGVTLQSGNKYQCCVEETLAKFYRSMNSILRIDGRADDMVTLRLMEAHCLPILTYGIEIIDIANRDEKRQLRVAYNAIYRKLFGYSYRESVTNLQRCLNRPTWEELTERRRLNFLRKCGQWPCDTLVGFLNPFS